MQHFSPTLFYSTEFLVASLTFVALVSFLMLMVWINRPVDGSYSEENNALDEFEGKHASRGFIPPPPPPAPQPERIGKKLEQALRDNASVHGIAGSEFVLKITRDNGSNLEIYVRPSNRDGETKDYFLVGNRLLPINAKPLEG